ncbi:hypothetical protein [Streptomyces misionensis]|uniref:hypothetical protein n=1 Tax=Streptomyces misionensis TaxID=67331 RepID=UPI00396B98FC
MKTANDMHEDDPNDDDPTVAHRLSRVLDRLRTRAAKKAARYSRDAKRQFIRGVSYGVGSGAVSILILAFKHQL